MSALWLRTRVDARRHRTAWVVLIVLVGVLAGALAAAGAGAVRTWGVTDRFVAETDAADLFLAIECDGAEDGCDAAEANIQSNPLVAANSIIESLRVPITDVGGSNLHPSDDCQFSGAGALGVLASNELAFERASNRSLLVDGIPPTAADRSAVVVSQPFAERTGTDVGDRLELYLDGDPCDPQGLWGEPTEVRVAAIGLMQVEVIPEFGFYLENIHLSPALSREATAVSLAPSTMPDEEELEAPTRLMMVVLAEEASADELVDDPTAIGVPVEIAVRGEDLMSNVFDRFGPDVITLTLVAALGAVGLVLVLGTAIARQATATAHDARTLRALGWTRRDLVRLGLLEGAIAGLVAGVLCAATAIVLSPLAPLGDAKLLDPLTGLQLEPRVVVPAALAAWALVTVSFAFGLRRAAVSSLRAEPRRRGRSWVERAVSAVPALPVTASTGCRMASQSGTASGSVPVRSGTTGMAVGLVGIVGAFTFVAGLDHLASTPRMVGWNWDVAIFVEDEFDTDQLVADLEADPGIKALSVGTFWPVAELSGPGDTFIWPMSFSAGPSAIRPSIIEGRAPEGPDEIAVLPPLFRDLDLSFGDSIAISALGPDGASVEERYEVVGTTVLPLDGNTAISGVAMTFDGVARFGEEIRPHLAYVDLAPGATWDEVASRIGVDPSEGALQASDMVEGFDNTGGIDTVRMRQAPQVLVLLLGAMVIGVLAHLVVTTVSQRRGELAVLRALGYLGRQTRSTVAWLVTVLVGGTLLIAVPVGIILGQRMWIEWSTGLDIVPEAAIPWIALLLVVQVTLLVANLVALLAGRRLTGLSTPATLRSE